MNAPSTVDVLREARRLLADGLVDPHDAPTVAALWRAAGFPEFLPAGAAEPPGARAAYTKALRAVFAALAARWHEAAPSDPPISLLVSWDFCRGLPARLRLLAEAEAHAYGL